MIMQAFVSVSAKTNGGVVAGARQQIEDGGRGVGGEAHVQRLEGEQRPQARIPEPLAQPARLP